MAADAAREHIRVESSEETPILHRVDVEVDEKWVKRAFDRAYQDLAKRANVKGFRPGKAPRSVLEKLYGASLGEQIEHTLVSETLQDAIETTGLVPVAEPAIEAGTPAANSPFRYSARVEVKPSIELPDVTGLAGQKPRVEVGDEEVDAELESLRTRNAPLVEEPEGTPAAADHTLEIDFVGRVDGETFEGGTGDGVELEIGSGRFIPGFEEQLIGAAAGDDREVHVTFPSPYAEPSLAGKDAVFAVHVVSIKARQVPALDDDFAKDLGDFETLDALKERIRSDHAEERERQAKLELRRTLMDSLIERTPFEVPSGMIERALQQRLASAHRRLQGQVEDPALHAQLDRWKEEWREAAEREVREALLLEAVAEAQGISVEEPEVELKINELAERQGVDPAVMKQASGEEALTGMLRAQMLDEKALDFLIGTAKVEETTDT